MNAIPNRRLSPPYRAKKMEKPTVRGLSKPTRSGMRPDGEVAGDQEGTRVRSSAMNVSYSQRFVC